MNSGTITVTLDYCMSVYSSEVTVAYVEDYGKVTETLGTVLI